MSLSLQAAKWRVPDWFGNEFEEKIYHDLRVFHVELLRFNEKMNLISMSTITNADEVHFADSILATKMIMNDFDGDRMVDIGSGNGFPGLVMAILNQEKSVTFVETRSKRVEFIKHISARLGLTNVEVFHQRIEDLAPGSVNAGVSRAFAPLPHALLLTRKIFAVGGVYYHLKSDVWASEVAQMPHQLCSVWNVEFIGEYQHPLSKVDRAIIKAEKRG